MYETNRVPPLQSKKQKQVNASPERALDEMEIKGGMCAGQSQTKAKTLSSCEPNKRNKHSPDMTAALYRMTQQPLPPSRVLPSRLLLLPLPASSSSIISAGRTDMWTTLGLSGLK